MSKKKLKETEYSVTKDEMPEIMPELEPNLQDDDRVSITNENEINETLKISIHHIINALGIQFIKRRLYNSCLQFFIPDNQKNFIPF